MAVRSTMTNLITRVRLLINDPFGANAVCQDQDIQDVMDESRLDFTNKPLEYAPTYVSGSIQYLNYWHKLTNWEDGMVFKQYLSVTVTPASIEPIAPYFRFAANTFPPVYITGSVHDIWRSAADLAERRAAFSVLSFDFSSDGQSFKRSQMSAGWLALSKGYRMKQRAGTMSMTRS